MQRKLVSVAIPIYKLEPSISEIASFKQCLSVLCRYDIILVCPESLDISNYELIAKGKVRVERFRDSFFDGIDGYNRLCMDSLFYKRFVAYEYILIYQLDAWVFHDGLEYWCNKGYDYIGAPWAYYTNDEKTEGGMWAVGNGGLSLRKISYFIKILTTKFPVRKRHLSNWRGYLIPSNLIFNLGWKNTISYILRHNELYEDMFFSLDLQNAWYKPNIPSCEVAMSFSFEKCPALLYQLNNHKLPFGCHAYHRYEYESFWKRYIFE